MEKSIILKAENIYKSFRIKSQPETVVIKGISMEVSRGEFTAVMGPSGVGKSTLLHILGSLDKPDRGYIELSVDSKTYSYQKMSDEALSLVRNQNIGFVFQFHHLLPEFTSLENVMMPALIAGKKFDEAREKAHTLMQSVGVEHRSNHKPSELSGGEQQRVAIARAIINEPAIVFADEPTGNLDSQNATAVLDLINNLVSSFNLTCIVATHSPEVAKIARRIIIMGDGRITDDKIV